MRAWFAASFLIMAGATLVACGGGGGSTAAPAIVTPTPVPLALPTSSSGATIPLAIPSTSATSVAAIGATVDVNGSPVPTPSPSTAPDGSSVIPIAFPTVVTTPAPGATATPTPAPGSTTNPVTSTAGVTGSFAIPSSAQIPAGTTLSQGISTSAATGVGLPALSRARVVLDNVQRLPLLFLSTRFSSDVTFPNGPTLSVSIPVPLPASLSYFVALYDPLRPSLGWQYGYEGPTTPVISGGVTTLSYRANPAPITFTAYQTYYFALYAQSAAAASPTPVPVNVATIAPSPSPAPLVPSTSQIQILGTAAANATSFSVAEAGYAGAFTVNAPSCSGIATVTIAGATVSVTPIAVGKCQAIVAGDRGRSTIVQISVNTGGSGIVIPGPTATPTATPAPPFSVPSALAVNVNASTTLTVGAGAITSGPVLASTTDSTIAKVSPNIWTSPLPATFTVTGIAAGQTSVVVSDANASAGTPNRGTAIPITVGAVGTTITVPGFPTPNPTPVPPGVTPASVSSLTAGTSMTFTVTGAPGYSGPIFASTNGSFYLSVQPNVWTSPLPATFTVTGSGGNSPFSAVNFSDANGGSRTVTVPVVAPPPVITASVTQLKFTAVNQFLNLTITERYQTGTIYAAVCSSGFVFGQTLATWPSGFTPPAASTYASGFAPTATFFVQAKTGGGGTCTATFYDLLNGISVSVPLLSPP